MIRALALLALAAVPASAQSAAEIPGRMALAWETFQTECRQALMAPEAFLQATPPQTPAGQAAVATSPDGQVLFANRFANDQIVEVRVFGLPEMRVIHCTVRDNGFNAATIDVSIAQDPAPWVDAFETVVQPAAPRPFVGGQVPIAFAYKGMQGEWIGQVEGVMRTYATALDWDGETVFANATIGPMTIAIGAVRQQVAE